MFYKKIFKRLFCFDLFDMKDKYGYTKHIFTISNLIPKGKITRGVRESYMKTWYFTFDFISFSNLNIIYTS
jgi:hypothetical protein